MAENRDLQLVLKLKDEASGKLKKSADSMVKTGAKLSLAFSVPLGLAVKSFINVASEAEETQAKFNTVFKGIESDVNKWADEFANSVGRANKDIKSFTAGLSDVLKPMGLSTKQASEMSKEMVQLALDVASFNNRQDADVIRAFTSALTGERESLKTLGIVISEADVQQEAYNSGLARVGETLSKTAKAQATMNLLFKNSKDAQGDLLRTSDSFANKTKALSAQITNLKEKLGNELLPTAVKIVDKLSKMTDWAFKLDGNTKDLVKSFIVFVGVLGPVNLALGGMLKVGLPLIAFTKSLTTSVVGLRTALSLTGGVLTVFIASATALGTYLTSKINSSYDEIIGNLEKTGNQADALREKLISARSPIKDLTGELSEMGNVSKETADKIKNLEKEISNTIKDESNNQAKYKTDLAEAIIEQEDKVAELTKQVKEKSAEASKTTINSQAQEELAILKDKLAQEETALQTAKEQKLGIQTELTEARRRAELTDFELKVENLNKQRELDQKQFIEKLALQQAELTALRSANKEVEQVQKDTTKVINDEYEKRAVKSEESARRQIRANASVVGISQLPGLQTIAPRETRLQGVISGGLNVTVNGDVSGEDLISKVGNSIMNQLRGNQKL